MQTKRLDAATFVSGQIAPEDVAALAAFGVTMIVNNRPDEEELGQPSATEIGSAVREAGLHYRHIPVAGGFSQIQIEAMAEAIDAAEGPTLAFCRTGTRSTFLWALARSRQGESAEALAAKAAGAGYDLAPIRALLDRQPRGE